MLFPLLLVPVFMLSGIEQDNTYQLSTVAAWVVIPAFGAAGFALAVYSSVSLVSSGADIWTIHPVLSPARHLWKSLVAQALFFTSIALGQGYFFTLVAANYVATKPYSRYEVVERVFVPVRSNTFCLTYAAFQHSGLTKSRLICVKRDGLISSFSRADQELKRGDTVVVNGRLGLLGPVVDYVRVFSPGTTGQHEAGASREDSPQG